MFETRRRRPGASEVCHAEGAGACADMEEFTPGDQEEEDPEEAEIERDEEHGEVFLLRPKRSTKARNAPAEASPSAKGDINQFRGIPNGRPRGTGEKTFSVYAVGNMVPFGDNARGHSDKYSPEPARGRVLGRKELDRDSPLRKERTLILWDAKIPGTRKFK